MKQRIIDALDIEELLSVCDFIGEEKDLNPELMKKLIDIFKDEIPNGTRARTEDPQVWMFNKLSEIFGENHHVRNEED